MFLVTVLRWPWPVVKVRALPLLTLISSYLCQVQLEKREYGGAIFIDDESDTFQCGKGFNKGRWKMCNPRGKQPLLLYVLCHEYGSSLLINSFSNYSSEMPLANYQLFKRQACAVVKLQ